MVLDGRKQTSPPITPIRRLPGDSAPLGGMNTAATKGGEEVHSRGEGGTGPQGPIPIKKKIQEIKPEGEDRLCRGPKSSHGEQCSSNVLNLGFKL